MPWREDMRLYAVDVLRCHYAHVGPELHFQSPFQLLVAVVLSAQSTDKQVNRTTARLFERVHTPADLAALKEEELAELIKGVGIYRNKAKNLVQLGRLLVERYQSEVPTTVEELETLPGVGHKTANVVVSIAFGTPALAVDTHVFRVANRLGLTTAKNVVQTEKQLTELIPREDWAKAHHWLIHHGRYCCKAQRPMCVSCPVAKYCRYLYDESTAKEAGEGGEEDTYIDR